MDENLRVLSGPEIMNRIFSGGLQKNTPEVLESVRRHVSEACEELIELGARVRPLMVGEKRIGWVRGVHLTERKMLAHWYPATDIGFVESVLLLGTSLTREELGAFTGQEVLSLAKLIREMTEFDLSLAPYIAAFTTTSVSEHLWFGKGNSLTNYQEKRLKLPDGKEMTLLTPSQQAKLWTTLCSYREENKHRLEASLNATMIVRPWVGKSIDGYVAQVHTALRHLQPDSTDAWENIVRVKTEVDVNDGWGHPDDTVDGLRRELHGMLSGDKHEQVMDAFMRQQVAQAEAEKKRIDALVQSRGGPGVEQGERFVLTPAQVREREQGLRKGRPVPRDTEIFPTATERLEKYK